MMKKHYPLFSIALLLINFLVACGTQTSTIAGGNSGKATTTRSTSTLHSQVSCPSVGVGRAAVITPQAEGSHQAVIYTSYDDSVVGDVQQDEGVINFYNIVAQQHRPIITLPLHTHIREARLSPDGQWVLFTTIVNTSLSAGSAEPTVLQMIRIDGQGLQTLYCTNTQDLNDDLSYILWSPDQKYIAFREYEDLPAKAGGSSLSSVKVLNVTTGSITAVYTITGLAKGIGPICWLDNTHLYIDDASGFINRQKVEYIGLWDVTKGTQQQAKNLVTIAADESFVDFDVSKDHTKLFVSSCATQGGYACSGSGRLTVQPVVGTTRIPIYAAPTLAIRSIQVASNATLLFTEGAISDGDSNAGLWKIDQDGSNLTHLVKCGPVQSANNNVTTPDAENVSPDGSMYATQISTVNNSATDALEICPLSGGTPIIALSEKYREQGVFGIVGWTRV